MSFLEEMRELREKGLTDKYENFKSSMKNEMKLRPSSKIFISYEYKEADCSGNEVRKFIKEMLVKDGFKVVDDVKGINVGFSIYIYWNEV